MFGWVLHGNLPLNSDSGYKSVVCEGFHVSLASTWPWDLLFRIIWEVKIFRSHPREWRSKAQLDPPIPS